jgi:hypothetical protein
MTGAAAPAGRWLALASRGEPRREAPVNVLRLLRVKDVGPHAERRRNAR